MEQERLEKLKEAIKAENENSAKILYFDPKFFDVEEVLKDNPQIRGFTSKEFLSEETTFVVTKQLPNRVDDRGILYIAFDQLKFILSALFDFFVCNDSGLSFDASTESLIKTLSGDYNGQQNYCH